MAWTSRWDPARNASHSGHTAAREPLAFGHLGVVMFFAKWPLRVEVHSLWPPPCWASCQHGCPGRLPAPTCRNSAPGLLNANTLSITLGRAPVLGVPAACGHGGPDLPSRSSASRSGGPWPPCSALGLGHSRAPGLPLTRLQPCVCAGPCTAAPGCKRPHTPGSESSTGQCQGQGGGDRVSHRPLLHGAPVDPRPPRATGPPPRPREIVTTPREGLCHSPGNSNAWLDGCKELRLSNIVRGVHSQVSPRWGPETLTSTVTPSEE